MSTGCPSTRSISRGRRPGLDRRYRRSLRGVGTTGSQHAQRFNHRSRRRTRVDRARRPPGTGTRRPTTRQGWRVHAGGTGELTTPTGMALIAALGDTSEDLPPLTIQRTGVGAGTKDTHQRPNITRVVIGQPAPRPTGEAGDAAVLLETNVDDLDPRLWPGVLSRILTAGAADAWQVPIVMKKGRPAHILAVLAHPHQAEPLRDTIFAETSTMGIRETTLRKSALPRCWVDVSIDDGSTVPIKLAHRDGSIIQATPEFDFVAELAETQG